MSATFINGARVAEDIKREVAKDIDSMKARGINPGLAVVLVGDEAASSSYVNMKARTCEQLGIVSRKITLPSSLSTEQIAATSGFGDVDERGGKDVASMITPVPEASDQ